MSARLRASDAAGHIGAAAQGRLDLAVSVRTYGDRDVGAVVLDEDVVNESGIARATGGVNRHSACCTCVKGHSENLDQAGQDFQSCFLWDPSQNGLSSLNPHRHR